MKAKFSGFSKVKEKYLKFIRSQEVPGEPFKDKLGQLNNFYIPISEMIYKNYSKNKKTSIIGLSGAQSTGKSTISKILKTGFAELIITTSRPNEQKKNIKNILKKFKINPKYILTNFLHPLTLNHQLNYLGV